MKRNDIVKDDYILGFIRNQIQDLNNVLENVEEGQPWLQDYASENLLSVERNIRWLRKRFF